MKKLLAVSLSLLFCVSLAACNNTETASSSSSSSNNSSAASVADNSTSGSSDEGTELKNDELKEVEAKITPLIDKYYSSMQQKNYNDFKSIFPDFYITSLEKELTDNSVAVDDFMPNTYDYFIENYGNNFNFSYEIEQVIDLNEESIEICEKAISDTFGKTVDITKAYGITVKETITGDNVDSGESGTEIQWLMYEIDGKDYLYESYYES